MKITPIKGKKYSDVMGPEMNEISYPGLSLPLTAIPQARKWEAGKTYEVVLHVTMTGMHQRRNSDGSAEFDVVGVSDSDKVVKTPATKATKKRYVKEDEDEEEEESEEDED